MKATKNIIIVILCCLTLCTKAQQPPLPSNHGNWKQVQVVDNMQYEQRYYFNNSTGQFEPMSYSSPLATATLLLVSLSAGFVAIRCYRNGKDVSEK